MLGLRECNPLLAPSAEVGLSWARDCCIEESLMSRFRLFVVIVRARRLRCTSLLLMSGLVRMLSMNCCAYLRNSSDLLASARETTPTVKITSLLRVPRPNELLTFLYWLEGVSAASCCCCCDVWVEVLLEAEDLD